MLMPRTRKTARTRLSVGLALALTLSTAIVMSSWDPTEALCAIYTSEDPMWHLLACWRFPSGGGSPQG